MSWLDKRILVGTNVSTWLPTRYGPNGPDGTRHYVPIIIQASQVSSALTDFPVYVDLSTLPAAFWANVQSDGGDIRVATAAGVQVPAELVSINTGSETGELHFLASSVSSSSNTEFRIYYDGETTLSQPGVATTYGRNAVWSEYKVVSHMQDASVDLLDSTGNNNLLDRFGVTSANETTAQLSQGVNLDGSSDYMTIGVSDNSIFSSVEVARFSLWVRHERASITADEDYLAVEEHSSASPFLFWLDDPNNLSWLVNTTGGYSGVKTAATGLSMQTPTHLVLEVDAVNGDVRLYINGVEDGNSPWSIASGTISAHSSTYYVGASEVNSKNLDGWMDEMRLATRTFSADWSAAEHTNQNTPSTFYNVGSQANA